MNRCEAVIPRDGMMVRCGDTRDLISWMATESGGEMHYACPRHQGGLKRRFPTTLPERTSPRGSLGLGTPWTRGAFGPADIIRGRERHPRGLSDQGHRQEPAHVHRHRRAARSRRRLQHVDLFRTPPTSDAYRVALAMADRLRLHAEGVHA